MRPHHFGVKTFRTISVHMYSMAKQDEFIRITLRLPPALHARLTKIAGAKSLNAEIVSRLEESIRYQAEEDDGLDATERLFKAIRRFEAAVRRSRGQDDEN